MVEFTTKVALQKALKGLAANDEATRNRVGFVPTMGALHKGHISLVEQALKENQIAVVSIFVNPTQFNNSEDLKNYPRTQNADLDLLQEIDSDNRIWVYLPNIEDLYENGLASDTYDFGGIENEMEGKHRQGHFDGVGTVVSKLFEAITPDRAYFGEKDFQQLQIIKKLVEIKDFPIEIIGCPIVREANGLAMSSRNKHLSPTQIDSASLLYEILTEVKNKFESSTIESLQSWVSERFLNHPEFELEYFIIADEETLKTVEQKKPSKNLRAFIAAYIGGVRLIDNMAIH